MAPSFSKQLVGIKINFHLLIFYLVMVGRELLGATKQKNTLINNRNRQTDGQTRSNERTATKIKKNRQAHGRKNKQTKQNKNKNKKTIMQLRFTNQYTKI